MEELPEHKVGFINCLLNAGALNFRDFTLKSGRSSPYFINVGDLNDGDSTSRIGAAYANAIKESGLDSDTFFDLFYGIPEKGISLAIATSIELARLGVSVPWFFTRKMPKEYGEATNLTKAERRKALVVGRAPEDGRRIAILDDVLTTADTKYEALQTLNGLADNLQFPLLMIAVDRQEVRADGKSAVEEFTQKTGVPVVSVINAIDIYKHMRTTDLKFNRLANYLRVYGTEAARKTIEEMEGRLEQRIIEMDRSVIPACDVSTLEQFDRLVGETADVEKIGGYKVGMELALSYGLPRVVETVRKHTMKPIIYDHQKAGTDIPDTGKNFARACKNAGVDAVILFPQAGPETERAWIYHCLDADLKVIVGGRMTHPAYAVSEGGFITDEGAMEMYRIAARAGINHFVVPGNKTDVIKTVRELVEAEGVTPVFFAPGFVAQGGKIADAAKVAGDRFHGIVGRGIYEPKDKSIREAAREHTQNL